MHIVIDLAILRMVASASTQSHAEAVVDVYYSETDTMIVDPMYGHTWSGLTVEQMAQLYTNMSGQPAPEYGVALRQLRDYAATWGDYPQSEEELLVILKERESEVAAESVPEDDPVQAQIRANQMSRQAESEARQAINSALAPVAVPPPAPTPEVETLPPVTAKADKPAKEPKQKKEGALGGSVRRVWDLGDHFYNNSSQPVDMKEVRRQIMAQCEVDGINMSTAATQYGRWRQARGYASK